MLNEIGLQLYGVSNPPPSARSLDMLPTDFFADHLLKLTLSSLFLSQLKIAAHFILKLTTFFFIRWVVIVFHLRSCFLQKKVQYKLLVILSKYLQFCYYFTLAIVICITYYQYLTELLLI